MDKIIFKDEYLLRRRILVKLSRPSSEESLVYELSKKMKNNPCKLASVKYDEDNIDLVVINNLKIRSSKTKKRVVNTSKEKLRSKDVSLKTLQKYFLSPDYEIETEPVLLVIINEKTIIPYPISGLLNIKYKESEIRKFIKKEISLLKSIESRNSHNKSDKNS